MAPKKKGSKPVGIVRKGGKFFTCRHCQAKRKTMIAMNKHHREAHPNAQPARPKKDGVSIGQLRKRGMLKGLSDDDVTEAILIAKALRDPRTMSIEIKKLVDEKVKRVRYRGF